MYYAHDYSEHTVAALSSIENDVYSVQQKVKKQE
jgi:hypothetical protein